MDAVNAAGGMDWDAIFGLSNMLALLGWIVLLVLPRRWTWAGWAPRYIIPVALSVSYALIMMVHLAGAEGGFGSILEVRALFASDPVLVAGWQHYLAFDLLIGAWLASAMDDARIHRLVQAPILIATFMLGPLGWLLGMATIHLPKLVRPK